MPFKERLARIVGKVDGAIAAMIMGYDGIPIDESIRTEDNLDVQLLAVEYATLLKEIKRTVDVLKTGEMEEVSITTEQLRVIIRAVSDQFFMVLLVRKDANYGLARYHLKLHAPAFNEMLAE